MTGSDTSLEGAYALRTPADSQRLYKDWAETYDAGFATSHGYVYARRVAEAYLSEGGGGIVLDVGAGTGLVAEAMPGIEADAIDISPEMLDVAGRKGLYRNRIVGDLTKPLDLPDRAYDGVVSAGTFTHGHVGPVCLPELMRVTRTGALFVVGINHAVFDEAGFGSAFADLVADGAVAPMKFIRVPFYEASNHDHADDKGLIAIFSRLK
ncbi:MAG: class I SAM-dependent methyltransferase [Pseudomonadota bacterium]